MSLPCPIARRVHTSFLQRAALGSHVLSSGLTALRPSRGAERPAPRTPSGGPTRAAVFFIVQPPAAHTSLN